MTRYLIKVTYQEGPHVGTSFLLRKGGYVTEDDNIQWEDTTYASEGIAKRVCKMMKEANDFNRKMEREEEAAWIAKRGVSPKRFYIYETCTYEPYPVEVA